MYLINVTSRGKKMKLIFRKNDSATSLLLFIYNIYLSMTNKDSIKLTSLLQYMKAFGKNDSAVRMALSRATKAGLLMNSKKENEVVYTLSNDGKQAISYWNNGVLQFWKRYRLRNGAWDENWYFVSLHQTSEGMQGYQRFSEELDQLGFVKVNANTWVSPYIQQNEIHQLIKQYCLENYLVEIVGKMTIYQNQEQFFDQLFNYEKLKASYQQFTELFKPKYEQLKFLQAEENFIENGLSLPLLNDLGWNFFRIVTDDLVLPRHLLPQWEQDEAVKLFKEYREALLPHIHYFLKKFD